MIDYGAIPGTPEYHKKWTQEKAIADADAATRRAQRTAVDIAEEERASASSLPSVVDTGPVASDDPFGGMYGDPSIAPPANGGMTDEQVAAAGSAGMDSMANESAQAVARGGPSPFDVAMMSGQSGQAALGDAYNMAAAGAGGYQTVKQRDPMHPIVKQHAEATRENMGELRDAEEEAQAVQLQEGIRGIDFLNREREYMAASAQQREDAAAMESTRLADQLNTQRKVQAEIDGATKALRNAPPEDPGKFWSNRSAFQKVALTISAIAKGWLMGQGFAIDPMGTIREGIRDEVESARQNRRQLGEKLDASIAKGQQHKNLYDQLYAKIGDERLTRDALELSHFKSAQAELAKMQAEGEVAMTGPDGQRALAQLGQEIADREKALSAELAAHPEFRTKVVRSPNVWVRHPQTGEPVLVPRKFVEAESKRLQGNASALQLKGIDQAGDAARQERDVQGKVDVASIKASKKDVKERALESGDRKWVAEKTAKRREELHQLSAFKKDYADEIPGFVAGIGWTRPVGNEINPFWGAEEEEAYQRLKRPIMILLREESGAAIGVTEEAKASSFGGNNSAGKTEQEISEEADALLAGHNTEGALMKEIDRRIGEATRAIDHYERAPEEEQVEQFNRGRSAPRAPRASGGVGLPNVVAWDDEEPVEEEE